MRLSSGRPAHISNILNGCLTTTLYFHYFKLKTVNIQIRKVVQLQKQQLSWIFPLKLSTILLYQSSRQHQTCEMPLRSSGFSHCISLKTCVLNLPALMWLTISSHGTIQSEWKKWLQGSCLTGSPTEKSSLHTGHSIQQSGGDNMSTYDIYCYHTLICVALLCF